MISYLFKFECWYQLRKPITFGWLLLFFLTGVFMGSLRHLPYPDLNRNAPYFITYITGIISLATIFTITFTVAQSFLKDAETKMDSLVFAMPIRKFAYLFSPFAAIFTLTFFAVFLAIFGLLIGHYSPWLPGPERGPFSLISYIWPLLVLAAPNILLCLSLTSCIAWLTRKSLSVYVGGVLIFVLYLVGSIFSNSPLMAGASPATPEAMSLTAKLDPFGLAAYFEQTRFWTVAERNTSQFALAGNFLLNRILWVVISFAILLFTYRKFSFRNLKAAVPIKRITAEKSIPVHGKHQQIPVDTNTFRYQLKSTLTLVQMDFRVVVKGFPLFVLLLIWTALLVFEITNALDGGVRMAALFANTSLMVSEIVKNLPFMGSLILLFYSNELLWKSKNANFLALASTSSVSNCSLYIAKLISLVMISFGLICWSIGTGITLQFIYDFPVIEFDAYGIVFYYIGLPFLLLIVFILFIQNLFSNKYLALGISALVILLFNSKLGLMLGINHPLLRFATTIDLPFFEMNGFGNYTTAFHWQLIQEGSLALILFLFTNIHWNRNLEADHLTRFRKLKFNKATLALLGAGLVITIISGGFISYQTSIGNKPLSGDELFDWRQNYEQKYSRYKNLQQPHITNVKTKIDLFPSESAYQVYGSYQLVNKSSKSIDTLLLYTDPNIELTSFKAENSTLVLNDKTFRHSFYRLNTPLLPGGTMQVYFRFRSSWSPFQPHNPTNSVLANGTFIRISRYFPRLGYQPDNEIDNKKERSERRLPKQEPLRAVDSPETDPYEFIHLDALVSTDLNQTALGSGELINSWKTKDRNYFHYKTDRPIPFRFAVSSARYQVKKEWYKGIGIEIYYDARHSRNVDRMLKNTKATLDYAEANFGPYPHRTIRIAEISSFATGFAATAYPNIIFAKENQGFYADLRRSDEQDVINQLAGHELAHLWWGSSQVNPDIRQGHSLMTETLAQYTELMLYRKTHGRKKSLELVKTHLDLYLAGRGFAPEMPLYKADLESPHLVYNKGMVVMYQLEQLIGEAQLNKALSMFLRNHAFPKPPPVSEDLLKCIYTFSSSTLHSKIDGLFKEVIVHNSRLKSANLKELNNGQNEITFSGLVQKSRLNNKGQEIPVEGEPTIEVGLEMANGQLQVNTFKVKNGSVSGKMVVSGKPTKVIIDPLFKTMETSPKDNFIVF